MIFVLLFVILIIVVASHLSKTRKELKKQTKIQESIDRMAKTQTIIQYQQKLLLEKENKKVERTDKITLSRRTPPKQ